MGLVHKRPSPSRGSDTAAMGTSRFPAAPMVAPEVTKAQENAVRAWLHGMGFDVAITAARDQRRHFLDDVLRNGVLLCDLVQTLEPTRDRLRVFRRPKTLQQARENTIRALHRLQHLQQAQLPQCYVSDPDGTYGSCARFLVCIGILLTHAHFCTFVPQS